jgi:hypothetical protein
LSDGDSLLHEHENHEESLGRDHDSAANIGHSDKYDENSGQYGPVQLPPYKKSPKVKYPKVNRSPDNDRGPVTNKNNESAGHRDDFGAGHRSDHSNRSGYSHGSDSGRRSEGSHRSRAGHEPGHRADAGHDYRAGHGSRAGHEPGHRPDAGHDYGAGHWSDSSRSEAGHRSDTE